MKEKEKLTEEAEENQNLQKMIDSLRILDNVRKRMRVHDIELVRLWEECYIKNVREFTEEKARVKANELILHQLYKRINDRNNQNDSGMEILCKICEDLKVDSQAFKKLIANSMGFNLEEVEQDIKE